MEKKSMGICPKCGQDYAGMTDYKMYSDSLVTEWECFLCNETWTEYACLTYDGYVHNDKEYNKDGELVR